MRRLTWVLLLPAIAGAIDHNNLDGGRPLTLQDAYTIGFGERTVEIGWVGGRRRGDVAAEFKVGFAKNREIGVGLVRGRVEASYFQNLRRETTGRPALGFGIHAGDREIGLDVVATATAGEYGRAHLNVGGSLEDNKLLPRVAVGYSVPLGYPRRFDRTLLLEVVSERGERVGAGVGIRQQLSPQTVSDVGLRLTRTWTITVGFSRSF